MSILPDIWGAWKKGGTYYVVSRAPGYAKKVVLYRLYNPNGTLNREDMLDNSNSQTNCWQYGDETSLEFIFPRSEYLPAQYRPLQGTHKIPPSFVCEIPDVTLVGVRAMCRLPNGQYILEEMGTETMLRYRLLQHFDSLPLHEKLRSISKPNLDRANYSDYDTLLNLVPRHGGSHNNYTNFGHWLLEDLPRLRVLDYYADRMEKTPDILIRSDPPDWMIDTLRLLGLSTTDWIEWDRKSASVSTLVVPKLSYIHSSGASLAPADRRWVRDKMKSNLQYSEVDCSKRIFISRQGQQRRRIENYDAVMTALEPYGFEAIRPEEFTLEEQIQIFDQATMIVGPFGAGLTGALFAESGTLIEIKPADTEHTVYYILATEAGLNYDFVMGSPRKNKQTNIKKDSDIRVNTNDLISTVENSIKS